MAEQAGREEMLRLLRLQRHDFINHIQVVQALVQLGKIDKALRYIDDMVNSPEMSGDPLVLYQARIKDKLAE
ncbi:MAG: Spo0B domain-containing protein [Sporomusaceae bacterium]|nr:Spo0B domain-containing protein [Sporomusaceae bacterium]